MTKKLLGEGSFGKVYQGICIKTGKEVAIKQIDTRDMCKSELEYQVEELAIVQVAFSEYVAKVYDTFEDENFMYIIMELING